MNVTKLSRQETLRQTTVFLNIRPQIGSDWRLRIVLGCQCGHNSPQNCVVSGLELELSVTRMTSTLITTLLQNKKAWIVPLLVLVISRDVASCIQLVSSLVAPKLCICPKMEKKLEYANRRYDLSKRVLAFTCSNFTRPLQ